MDTISFRNVPVNWQLCFLDDCPVKDKCLRQLVAHHLSDDRTFGPAIYPTMKRGDEGCRLFATTYGLGLHHIIQRGEKPR